MTHAISDSRDECRRRIEKPSVRFPVLVFCLSALVASPRAGGQGLPRATPEAVGMSSRHLDNLEAIVIEAIERKDFPGAVLLVARRGRTVYRKSFGLSQRVPEAKPMSSDMIFDLASLTKPVATATAVMILVEKGKIRLWDKVSDFVPEFSPYFNENGTPGEDARLFHLLTHTSGLPPYADPEEIEKSYGAPCPTETLVRHIAEIPKESRPGERFVYSCLNFITLAHIVAETAGQGFAEFVRESIFVPLGMRRTFFTPPPDTQSLCVPTEVVDGRPLRGVVHDPLARLQGGVSGNAGLFSTADDLAVFAQMVLDGGVFGGKRILSPLTVERMTEIFPEVSPAGRGLGWDLVSSYGTVRGDLFDTTSFGHTGYTGTSIWIDPDTKTAVVFLTNRVHPDDSGDIVSLRSRIANVVAASCLEK
jgi:CubicO group peptidase (beta-lactamase class C family)